MKFCEKKCSVRKRWRNYLIWRYSLEKNQVPRELALIALSLACLWLNETHMVEAENKYHTVYPSWDGPSVVCYLFLYLFICVPTTSFTWLSTFCTLQLSSTFYLSQDHSWCRASFLKGTYNFQNCLRIQFVKVFAQ